MDYLAACADLCEHHGFAAPAAALRALADGRAPFYLVRALMDPEYAIDEGFDAGDVAPPDRRVFLDRKAAERYAQALTARAIRNLKTTRERYPSYHYDVHFSREVGAILGVPYQIPETDGIRLFPPEATDTELLRLGEYMLIELFDVAEFAAGPDPGL